MSPFTGVRWPAWSRATVASLSSALPPLHPTNPSPAQWSPGRQKTESTVSYVVRIPRTPLLKTHTPCLTWGADQQTTNCGLKTKKRDCVTSFLRADFFFFLLFFFAQRSYFSVWCVYARQQMRPRFWRIALWLWLIQSGNVKGYRLNSCIIGGFKKQYFHPMNGRFD